ncbi:hypothetical protein FHS61_002692 [Altererythrobacter atlanticus]|uniref:Uncharacterized protein n=1 Tax=Croceibacterium atlanticum TaxID=1267766 RepID=A0A0F7KXF9_9SPHN|nr:DUF1097 domain-containing protein [Croceibacterium atlanticum]AKH43901.1 hypothetical protein WYH_02874 [Croceibacterium atlanticum]MBB5733649.1 hypothetical protein [Croceibacterium atlanticum]
MPALFALAVSVGVLAVVDTWLFVGPLAATSLAGLVWISFIAWGCHFQSGGGTKGSTTAIVCMSWGALVGMVAVMLAGGALAGLGIMAAPVAVGLGAALICLSSAIGWLSTIPASVYGFASIAGPILLADKAPQAAFVPVVLAVVIGAAFGFVSEMLANALTKKGGANAEATADPEHA